MRNLEFLFIIIIFFPLFASGMKFIDSDGRPYELTQNQFALFLASDLGTQLKDDIDRGRAIDFRGVQTTPLKGKNILRVLNHVHEPEQLTLTSEVVPEEIALLETANSLGLQDQTCARHLANRLWPLVQKNGANPLHLSDWQKGYARTIARNYVACPAHMLEYLEEHKDSIQIQLYNLFDRNGGRLRLSHNQCCNVGYPNKFGTLAGLEKLTRYLCKHIVNELSELILDDHLLDTFSLKDIQFMGYKENMYDFRSGLKRLSLCKNCLSELSEHQIDTSHLPAELDLSGNNITRVTDETFQAINHYRTRHRTRFDFQLSLESNPLSESQKIVLQKKFYNATHTIPERWTINRTIVVYKWLLAIAPIYALDKGLPYFEESNIVSAAAGCLVCFYWWYLFVNRFDMRLAQISHPTMDGVWGGDFHDRSWAIWPKNNAKLLI